MSRKRILFGVITLALLMTITTIAAASDRPIPAYQDGGSMPTATALPLAMTPMPGMGGSGSMAMGGCPMMSSTSGTAGMQSMPSMPGMSSTGSMGSMTSASGMTGMTGMTTMGNGAAMNGMPMNQAGYYDGDEVVITDPATWPQNPWTLLGWIVLGLVLLAILGGLVIGAVWIIRRIAPRQEAARPAAPRPETGA